MNLDNFVVRPQRKSVEKYAKPEAWLKLVSDDFNDLAQNVAGLPTGLVDEDEDAKRFDILVLRTQLVILQARPDFASLREENSGVGGRNDDDRPASGQYRHGSGEVQGKSPAVPQSA